MEVIEQCFNIFFVPKNNEIKLLVSKEMQQKAQKYN